MSRNDLPVERVHKGVKEQDMGIEQDIKQPRFQNAWHKAGVNLLFTYGWLKHRFQNLVHPFGITIQQYNALRILRGMGSGMTTSEIRDRLLDRNADSSRLVERLVRMGYAHRCVHPSDGRLVSVTITESGLDLLSRIDLLQPEFDGLLGNLTVEEADQLNELLDKLRGG